MSIWLVRAGSKGERQDYALDEGLAVIGWDQIPDMTRFRTRAELETAYKKLEPDRKHSAIANWVGQLWAFYEKIQISDLIVLPLKRQNAIAIGKVTGGYKFDA